MSGNAKQEKSLEDRVKSLEILQRNARIAIIILVGYSIYDVISLDSGSDIVFAHKVKARQFELIDGQGTVFGNWMVMDEGKRAASIVMQGVGDKQINLSADEVKLTQGRVNPSPLMVLDKDGVRLYENNNSEPAENK